ncbi:MAG: hypothetical protein ACOCRU_01060 [bacterium]
MFSKKRILSIFMISLILTTLLVGCAPAPEVDGPRTPDPDVEDPQPDGFPSPYDDNNPLD